MRVAQIEGADSDGQYGVRCVVVVERASTRLSAGQQLAVYGPQARVAGGKWSEAPIAILRVLGVNGSVAFTQPLLIHEEAHTRDSKRLHPGLSVEEASDVMTTFLVPAFGDGFIHHEPNKIFVFLRPGV